MIKVAPFWGVAPIARGRADRIFRQCVQDLKVIGQIFEVLTSTEKLGEQQSESRQGLELKSFREESL